MTLVVPKNRSGMIPAAPGINSESVDAEPWTRSFSEHNEALDVKLSETTIVYIDLVGKISKPANELKDFENGAISIPLFRNWSRAVNRQPDLRPRELVEQITYSRRVFSFFFAPLLFGKVFGRGF